MREWARKSKVFWPLLLVVLLTDCTTKAIAVESLSPPGTPFEVVGETVRLNLAYNERGAMGIPTGDVGRKVLGLLAIAISLGLFAWYRHAGADDRRAGAMAALFIAGALGNGWERLISSAGVVDFIDVGVGSYRFWTFNVADVALTAAAFLLVAQVMRREPGDERRGTAF